MLQPLAIVFYERIMPGSQLVNRLQDLNYRVRAVHNLVDLADKVYRDAPMLVIADLAAQGDVCGVIEKIKADPATAHVPIISFAPDNRMNLLTAAQKARANQSVIESVLLNHLQSILEQALQLE